MEGPDEGGLIPPSRAPGPRPAVVRELRRKEGEAFLSHVVAHAGEMDRRLDLIDRSVHEMRGAFGPGVWSLLRLLRLLGRAPVRFLVAEADGQLVGTTLVLLLKPWAYMAAVGVSPSHRRQGIAQALVRRAEGIARAAHKPRLVLDVDAGNAPALALYAKLGFARGLRAEWWRLPVTPTTAGPVPGGTAGARPGVAEDLRYAVSRARTSLALPLPPRHLHPLELMCQGRRDQIHEWALGPPGSPAYFARTYLARPGTSSYLLGVPGENASAAAAREVIHAGHEALARTGTKAVFAPVRDSDALTQLTLEGLGSSRVALSESWWKLLP